MARTGSAKSRPNPFGINRGLKPYFISMSGPRAMGTQNALSAVFCTAGIDRAVADAALPLKDFSQVFGKFIDIAHTWVLKNFDHNAEVTW